LSLDLRDPGRCFGDTPFELVVAIGDLGELVEILPLFDLSLAD